MKRQFSLILLVLLVLFLVYPQSIYATDISKQETKATIGTNDGKPKTNPFMDSGAPTRYSSGKYYDVALPYDTLLNNIGGMDKTRFPADSKKKQIGCMLKENDEWEFGLLADSITKDAKGLRDEASGLRIIEKNGVQYYMGAIGQGLFCNDAWDGLRYEGFDADKKTDGKAVGKGLSELLYNGTPAKSGILFDLILKDGTQIHFTMADSLGISEEVGGWGGNWDRRPMIHKQYTCMWHAGNAAHVVEYFGSKGQDKVMAALNITNENPVMYVRIWNISLNSADKVKCKAGQEKVSNSGTALSTASDGSSAAGQLPTQDANGNQLVSGVQYMKGEYSESMLSTVNALMEGNLEKANRDSLTMSDGYTLNNWKDTVESRHEDSILVIFFRRFVSFIGIMFTVWMLFLYLGYWFDRVNNFIDFSLLGLLSGGRLKISPEEDKCTWQFSEMRNLSKDTPMTVNNRAMLEIVIIGCIFGGLIVSGLFFDMAKKLLVWLLSCLGLLK